MKREGDIHANHTHALQLLIVGAVLALSAALAAHKSSVELEFTYSISDLNGDKREYVRTLGGLVWQKYENAVAIIVPRYSVDLEHPNGAIHAVRALRRNQLAVRQEALKVEIGEAWYDGEITQMHAPDPNSPYAIVRCFTENEEKLKYVEPLCDDYQSKLVEEGSTMQLALGDSYLTLNGRQQWELEQPVKNMEEYQLPLKTYTEKPEDGVPYGTAIVDGDGDVVGMYMPDDLSIAYQELTATLQLTNELDEATLRDAQNIQDEKQRQATRQRNGGVVGILTGIVRFLFTPSKPLAVLGHAFGVYKGYEDVGEANKLLNEVPPYLETLLGLTDSIRDDAIKDYCNALDDMKVTFEPGLRTEYLNLWWDDRYGTYSYAPDEDWQVQFTMSRGSGRVMAREAEHGREAIFTAVSRVSSSIGGNESEVRTSLHNGAYSVLVGTNCFYREHALTLEYPTGYSRPQSEAQEEPISRLWEIRGETSGKDGEVEARWSYLLVVQSPGGIAHIIIYANAPALDEDGRKTVVKMWESMDVVGRSLGIAPHQWSMHRKEQNRYQPMNRGKAQLGFYVNGELTQSPFWRLGDRIEIQCSTHIAPNVWAKSRLVDAILNPKATQQSYFEKLKSYSSGYYNPTDQKNIYMYANWTIFWGHEQIAR